MLLNRISVSALVLVVGSLMLLTTHAKAQSLRDPTLPGQGYVAVSSSIAPKQAMVLNSIVNGQRAYAVINNNILSVGDTVSGIGLRVTAIGQDSVTLSDGRKLQLFQSITER
ncbi:MSHA biogenesis protein MshK [Shewanella litoralis]|uniref:MSHA biogenesis protein MshK n=2 Tax=Shewanella litoralis TaxID=2282700 RepID=A0ABQ2R9F3_9GAMM|nr:MSHA biogenesis protein MshK [Shewanella litoralis]